jgi:aryl-alcohol dehydrogenase-like predicted oxidoreductase
MIYMEKSLFKQLGHSSIKVSPLGMGCWAIGGFFMNMDGVPCGWAQADDAESVRTIKRAVELGVNFFETSDVYGTGHSEKLLGQALSSCRSQVVIATKFGYVPDERKHQYTHEDVSPEYIRQACKASLQRLQTDYIDLYQLHVSSLAVEVAESVSDTLESLVKEGLIRSYGWSTDSTPLAEIFAANPNCAAIEYKLNVFRDNADMIALCDKYNVSSIARSPLSMGLLSGKFTQDSVLPSNDVRGANNTSGFKDGKPLPEFLDKFSAIREIITTGGRTPAQGALAWILGRNPNAIPIPGFKTVKQAEENIKAVEFGPLTPSQMKEIADILLTI